jgi:hypothetical protein
MLSDVLAGEVNVRVKSDGFRVLQAVMMVAL